MAGRATHLHALFQEGGSHSNSIPAKGYIFDYSNCDLHPGWLLQLATGDAVQARLQRAQAAQQAGERRMRA